MMRRGLLVVVLCVCTFAATGVSSSRRRAHVGQSGVLDGLKGVVKDATDTAKEAGEKALDAIKESGAGDAVLDAANTAGVKLVPVRTAVDDMFDKVTGVTTKGPATAPLDVNTVVKKEAGASTGAPEAPKEPEATKAPEATKEPEAGKEGKEADTSGKTVAVEGKEAAAPEPEAPEATDVSPAKEVVAGLKVCPVGCSQWFDGCNTCTCNDDGTLGGCTKKACVGTSKLLPNCSEQRTPQTTTAAPTTTPKPSLPAEPEAPGKPMTDPSTPGAPLAPTPAKTSTTAAPATTTTAAPTTTESIGLLAESLNCTVHKDDLEWTLDDMKAKWTARIEKFDEACKQEQTDIVAAYEATRQAAEDAMNANITRVQSNWTNATQAQQALMGKWKNAHGERIAGFQKDLARLDVHRVALNETLYTAIRDDKVAREAERNGIAMATMTYAASVAAKKAETDEAMSEDVALRNETLRAAKRVLDEGTAICAATHDEVVALVNDDPFYKVAPELKALNECREKNLGGRRAVEAVTNPADAAAAVPLTTPAFLEVSTGCTVELLALQEATSEHVREAQESSAAAATTKTQRLRAALRRRAEAMPTVTAFVEDNSGALSMVLHAKNTTKRERAQETAAKAISEVVAKMAGAVAKEEVEAPAEKKGAEKPAPARYLGPIADAKGNPLTIPLAAMEAKLQGQKDAAAEVLGKCTGVLQAVFDQKQGAADKKFDEDTEPLRGMLEKHTTAQAQQRDARIAVVRGDAINAAEGLRAANETIVAKHGEIAKVAGAKAGWEATRDEERPGEQAKVDAVIASGVKAVAAVTKKAKRVYASKTKPLPALQKAEQEEAVSDCAVKRVEIVKDGKLIDALTGAAKREVAEKKAEKAKEAADATRAVTISPIEAPATPVVTVPVADKKEVATA